MSISAERPKFEMVPHWVMDHPNVSLRGLQVYLFLRRYADYETGEAWPSRKTLASEIGVSLSTLDDAIANLRTIGAVTVAERFGERGQQSNLYTVLFYQDGGQVILREGVTPINRDTLPRKSTSPPPGESVTEQDPLNKTQGTRQETLLVADANQPPTEGGGNEVVLVSDPTPGQIANQITRGFYDQHKGAVNFNALRGVVTKLVKAGYDADRIATALTVTEGRGAPLTVDVLRQELEGRRKQRQSRTQKLEALSAKYAAMDDRKEIGS